MEWMSCHTCGAPYQDWPTHSEQCGGKPTNTLYPFGDSTI